MFAGAGFDGFWRMLSGMTGEGLEPSTNGLTYRIGFRRPPEGPRRGALGVAGLDSPIAIAGVPRRVSGAGPGDPPGPCLLMTQSLAFSTVTPAVAGSRCGVEGSQGVPAYCGIYSSPFAFFPREAPIRRLEVRCSTD